MEGGAHAFSAINRDLAIVRDPVIPGFYKAQLVVDTEGGEVCFFYIESKAIFFGSELLNERGGQGLSDAKGSELGEYIYAAYLEAVVRLGVYVDLSDQAAIEFRG